MAGVPLVHSRATSPIVKTTLLCAGCGRKASVLELLGTIAG